MKPCSMRCSKPILWTCLALATWVSGRAQTPPGDLTEMSLEQILGLRIVSQSTTPSSLPPNLDSKWSLGHRYIRINFDGNCDGTDEVPISEVLWAGPSTPRTSKNFPIVPNVIHQEAYVTSINYMPGPRWSWNLLLPYIVQETDHIANGNLPAIGPEFSEFLIRSEGWGDISLNPSYQVLNRAGHSLTITSGLSFPVGSITEHGDTPAPGASNQLPYTMQLGSGTFDYLPGITYIHQQGNLRWGTQALATIRLGRNNRGYTLGNRLSLGSWVRLRPVDWLEPNLSVSAQFWERIDGVDEEFAQFVGGFFPATVADPSKYGGEKVTASAGVNFIGSGRLDGQTLEVTVGSPLYQRLNGPQPREIWRLSIAWNWDL